MSACLCRCRGSRNNFQGKLTDVFACLARLGTGGCGYEHQLQSVRLALHERLTPENAGFLRPDAYLAIIIVTDEDDCSGAQDSALYASASYPMTEPNLRCAREGHLCRGRTPPIDGAFSAPLAECHSNDDGKLLKVQELIQSIKRLKSDPKKIFVSAIVGWPERVEGARYAYTRRENGNVDYDYVCETREGKATAAVRIKDFVDGFDATRSTVSSI